MKTEFVKKYWTNGYVYRHIISDNGFIVAIPNQYYPTLEKRQYSTGIEDLFDPNDGWKPCTQDDFVQAYVKAINQITAASGIEHLPLVMEPDFLTESNPES